MGRPPAIVIIARHGARLDAADKQWHLTSPTPYDPPLTYGGWTQGRSLGARIASILHGREGPYYEDGQVQDLTNSNQDVTGSPGGISARRKKKHKIIIHSSPFVRCVQTSIAIAAGIGQIYQPFSQEEQNAIPKLLPQHSSKANYPGRASSIESSNQSVPIFAGQTQSPTKLHIATLRVDAFLGEWMTPEYYKDITPPPSSIMMVAGAKSDLLRPGEKLAGLDTSSTKSQGNFPGGWKSDLSESFVEDSLSRPGLGSMAALHAALPYRSRANTDSQSDSIPSKSHRNNFGFASSVVSDSTAYIPPTPAYALSSSDPIPPGYVAHARDACADVDYRWDSMRAPYDWGDGGEYGEEWSSMHMRFRTGLQRMINWYKDSASLCTTENSPSCENEEDTDTVLILVTHGAGCNALIGALTNQPVLLDVGMASLTMALRKEGFVNGSTSEQPLQGQRRGSIATEIAGEYNVELTASTDHLRVASSALGSTSSTPSPRTFSGSFASSRRPFGSTSSNDGFTIGEPLLSRSATTSGSFRNPNTTSSMRWALSNSSPKASSGLWGRPVTPVSDAASDSNDDYIPNFGRASVDQSISEKHDISKPMDRNGHAPRRTPSQRGLWRDQSRPKTTNNSHDDSQDEDDTVPDQLPTPRRTFSQRGLWNSSDMMSRDSGPKRRWTVTREHA